MASSTQSSATERRPVSPTVPPKPVKVPPPPAATHDDRQQSHTTRTPPPGPTKVPPGKAPSVPTRRTPVSSSANSVDDNSDQGHHRGLNDTQVPGSRGDYNDDNSSSTQSAPPRATVEQERTQSVAQQRAVIEAANKAEAERQRCDQEDTARTRQHASHTEQRQETHRYQPTVQQTQQQPSAPALQQSNGSERQQWESDQPTAFSTAAEAMTYVSVVVKPPTTAGSTGTGVPAPKLYRLTLRGDTSKITVESLKEAIADFSGVPMDQQRLSKDGKLLTNMMTGGEFGLRAGTVLYLDTLPKPPSVGVESEEGLASPRPAVADAKQTQIVSVDAARGGAESPKKSLTLADGTTTTSIEDFEFVLDQRAQEDEMRAIERSIARQHEALAHRRRIFVRQQEERDEKAAREEAARRSELQRQRAEHSRVVYESAALPYRSSSGGQRAVGGVEEVDFGRKQETHRDPYYDDVDDEHDPYAKALGTTASPRHTAARSLAAARRERHGYRSPFRHTPLTTSNHYGEDGHNEHKGSNVAPRSEWYGRNDRRQDRYHSPEEDDLVDDMMIDLSQEPTPTQSHRRRETLPREWSSSRPAEATWSQRGLTSSPVRNGNYATHKPLRSPFRES